MITLQEYQSFVADTSRAEAQKIIDLFTKGDDDDARELLAAIGMAGEGGEVLEHYKKWLFHGKPRDDQAIIKEIGDVLWYVFLWCEATGYPFEYILERNKEKLETRRAAKERQFAGDK
jgi:NTP pyrophosphatase (non-canonical NTP hydrolase)